MMPVRNKQFRTKTNMTLSKYAVLFRPFTIFLKNKVWTGNIFSLFFPQINHMEGLKMAYLLSNLRLAEGVY